MSSRPILPPFSVITDGNMSTSSLTSTITVMQNISMLSYSVSWVGTTPVGVITVETSNDYSQNADGTVKNAGTWNTLPLSAVCNVSGNSGNGMIDIDSIAGYAIRLIYTKTSGTGTLQAIVCAKVA